MSSLFFAVIGLISTASAKEAPHWGYTGKTGPANWGKLAADFSACSQGKNQSPINLTRMIQSKLPPLMTAYKKGGTKVYNNGHTIGVVYAKGSSLTVDGQEFELKQFHFHTSSENTIEGQSFPMEVHFVHANQQGQLAVVAVMFKAGKANAELGKIWQHLPLTAGQEQPLQGEIDINQLLPQDHAYYRYNGSLTTPPCSEGVRWLVIKTPVTASRAQLMQFAQLFPKGNNRPLQALNARLVME